MQAGANIPPSAELISAEIIAPVKSAIAIGGKYNFPISGSTNAGLAISGNTTVAAIQMSTGIIAMVR